VRQGIKTGKIALWGIGQEFRDFVYYFDDVKKLIENGSVILVDSSLSGHRYCGSEILKPTDILPETTLKSIIIMPKLERTRNAISKSAINLGFNENLILDPCQAFKSHQPETPCRLSSPSHQLGTG